MGPPGTTTFKIRPMYCACPYLGKSSGLVGFDGSGAGCGAVLAAAAILCASLGCNPLGAGAEAGAAVLLPPAAPPAPAAGLGSARAAVAALPADRTPAAVTSALVLDMRQVTSLCTARLYTSRSYQASSDSQKRVMGGRTSVMSGRCAPPADSPPTCAPAPLAPPWLAPPALELNSLEVAFRVSRWERTCGGREV